MTKQVLKMKSTKNTGIQIMILMFEDEANCRLFYILDYPTYLVHLCLYF
jgi:hypothetical protein